MHLTMRRTFFAFIIVLFLLNTIAISDELETTTESDTIEYRNKIILFGGVTQHGGDAGASIGLEYEYRVNPCLALAHSGNTLVARSTPGSSVSQDLSIHTRAGSFVWHPG